MGVHHFETPKDDLNENPIGSYIYINGQEFLVRYKGQIETVMFAVSLGIKVLSVKKNLTNNGQSLMMVYQNTKLERMPKFLRNSRNWKKKTKKMKLCGALMRQTLLYSTIQNKTKNMTESTYDSSSNEKNYDWFEC